MTVPDGKLAPSWRQANVPGGFTLAAVGDLIADDELTPVLQRRDPDLLALLRSADVTFGNFESTAIDFTTFTGWPEAESGGAWLVSSPRVPADLRGMGFTLMSRANNHTTDWGVAGMRSTDHLLTEAGIVHAGTGENRTDACSPRFLNTRSGRVSLVSVATRFEPMSRAIDPLGRVRGRPGANTLRTTREVCVRPEWLEELARVRDALPAGSIRPSIAKADADNGTVTLFGTTYAAGKSTMDTVEFRFTPHEADRRELLHSIRQAKQTSDFAIMAIHTHEPGNYSDVPPDFLPVIAREAIDNGADAVIGHGPHQLRGIEVYCGRPICYSLGNFVFRENTQQPLTRDEYEKNGILPGETEAEHSERKRVHGVFAERIWYESVVTVARFRDDGRLDHLELHPVELRWEGPRDADRGIPRLAEGEVAARIIGRLQRLSQPYGTAIAFDGRIGRIAM
ncbi:CapA family protein [Amycolatopsis pigmentata]|uniref:CapA family protein n=1 Tax=Amycolatopsis pigmentata TaxID=450801 RepID=A0ABW5FLH0_9PSEU